MKNNEELYVVEDEEFNQYALKIMKGIIDFNNIIRNNINSPIDRNFIISLGFNTLEERKKCIIVITLLKHRGHIIIKNTYYLTDKGFRYYNELKHLSDKTNIKTINKIMSQKTLAKAASEIDEKGIIIQINDNDVSVKHSITHDETKSVVLIDEHTLLEMMMEIHSYRANNGNTFEEYRSSIIRQFRETDNYQQIDSLLSKLQFNRKLDGSIHTGDLSQFEIK